MTEFKVGDRVRVKANPHIHASKLGTVAVHRADFDDYEGFVAVRLDEYSNYMGGNDYHSLRPWDLEYADANHAPETFSDKVKYRTDKIASLLIAKNEAYGDSALNPVRVFSKAEPVEQIKVRIDDKISRLQRGTDAGEDTVTDLIGYLILLRIAEDNGGSGAPTHIES